MKVVKKYQNPNSPILYLLMKNKVPSNYAEIKEAAEKAHERKEAAYLSLNTEKPSVRDNTQSNDNTIVQSSNPDVQHDYNLHIETFEGDPLAWDKANPNLSSWRNLLSASPFLIAGGMAAAGTGQAAVGSSLGKAAINLGGRLLTKSKWIPSALKWANRGLIGTMGAEGVHDLTQGKFTPMTALSLAPIGIPVAKRFYGVTENILDPVRLKEHVFNNVKPLGYNHLFNDLKDVAKDVLSGKRADINNPKWWNNGYLYEGDKFAQARMDAWRLYNGYPLKYNTFTINPKNPKAYTASELVDEAKSLPSIHFYEDNYALSIPHRQGKIVPDLVNGAGGNVYVDKVRPIGNGWNGVTVLDLWDLLPFKHLDTFNDFNRRFQAIPKILTRRFGQTKVPKFMGDFEVGKLWGGKPFQILYDFPQRDIIPSEEVFLTILQNKDIQNGLINWAKAPNYPNNTLPDISTL